MLLYQLLKGLVPTPEPLQLNSLPQKYHLVQVVLYLIQHLLF